MSEKRRGNKGRVLRNGESPRSDSIFQRLALIPCDTLFAHACADRISTFKVLQDVMGHRNIRTTVETYAKAFRDKKVEAVMALNGAFKIS